MIIKLQQVIDAMEEADFFLATFWDAETGENVYLDDPMLTGGETNEEFIFEIESLPERFFRFPNKYEIHQYSIMEDYVKQLSPGKAREELSYVIRGKGAFRRFKQAIGFYGLEQQWYDYLAEAYKEIAIRWCKGKGLEYTE